MKQTHALPDFSGKPPAAGPPFPPTGHPTTRRSAFFCPKEGSHGNPRDVGEDGSYQNLGWAAHDAIRQSCAHLTAGQIARVLIDAGAWQYQNNFKTAEDRVRQCLSVEKNQCFSPGELLIIQKATGVHAWHLFEADVLGRRSERLTTELQLGRLEERLNEARLALTSATDTLNFISRAIQQLKPEEGKKPEQRGWFRRIRFLRR